MNNITPNLKEVMASTDSKSIQNAIALACETGVGQITIPAFNERTKSNLWVIDETILLPSGLRTLGARAFEDTPLTELALPAATQITDDDLGAMKQLEEITVENGSRYYT